MELDTLSRMALAPRGPFFRNGGDMQTDDRKAFVRQHAIQRLGRAPDYFASPLTVLASPVWRGVEGDVWVAQAAGKAETFKHYHDDVSPYVDVPAAMVAATLAGQCGVGPNVLQTWPQEGLMVMEWLGEGWQVGGLHHCTDPKLRSRIIAAKKALHTGEKFPRDGDIFAEIAQLHQRCMETSAALPKQCDAHLAFADQARAAMAARGVDKVPCHRDGNTANVMIGPNHTVKLLDYDLAANADPFEDLGCWLLEFFEREPEMRAGFEEWMGHFDEGLFQRAIIYGMLDDLRWGLIGLLMQATSARSSLEFSKYAMWRLMRFNVMAQCAQAADRLRSMA